MAKAIGTTEKKPDILEQAREDYERCREAWNDTQNEAREDLKFARLGQQWPQRIEQQRKLEERPCLTFNKMPAFIRQVVNDARQNKPSIKVHPQDSNADPRTAEIINGLIRNIETTSDADVAYDTAIEHAVGQGFGFWKINTRYTCDDAFEQDIAIERVSNPFTVLGDPRSTAADSSDWNVAFITSTMTRDEYEREYPKADKVDWDHDFKDAPGWLDGDDVVVAEYWTREKVKREIVALSDGSVIDTAKLEKSPEDFEGLDVVGEPREVESYKVTQRIMSGAEVLKKVEWAGQYIPIVPVYGDEVNDDDGKRHFRSLIRDAKSAQQMFNYWRTTTTELIALSPKAPWLVEVDSEGSMGIPADEQSKYDTANSVAHPYLAYRQGRSAPQRQPFTGVPAGALQEALNAADDMKSIIGIYDASLGARSNETSGRAIMARQREGDVSTFHFIDNLSRAIRHGGRILLDLIPKVYSTERMIRILGEDLKPRTVQAMPGAEVQEEMDAEGKPLGGIYDLTKGKYDLTVSAGPSFTTRREEAALQMESLIQKVPDAAALIGDLYAKSLDWPMADEIAERLKRMIPPQALGQQQAQVPPEVQQQMQQMQGLIQQGGQELQRLEQENQQLKAAQGEKAAEFQLRSRELDIKEQELQIKAIDAQTKRIQAEQPTFVKAPPQGTA